MKKIIGIIVLAWCSIAWLLCVAGILKGLYELFMGGVSNIYAADWLWLEASYAIIWAEHFKLMLKDPQHSWISNFIAQ